MTTPDAIGPYDVLRFIPYVEVRFVTAAGMAAGIDLGLFLLGEICGRERAGIVQLALEYDPQPPYDAGRPAKVSAAVCEAAKKEMLERAKNPRNRLSGFSRISRTVSKYYFRRCGRSAVQTAGAPSGRVRLCRFEPRLVPGRTLSS